MKIARPDPAAVAKFEALLPDGSQTKLVFGNPAAFVRGHMFFGVFGRDLFVRLSESEAVEADRAAGMRPFEPMPGRPMRGYVVLPDGLANDPAKGREWVGRAFAFASRLPPKKTKRR